MSFFSRVAAVAAMAISVAGLAAQSSAGLAAEGATTASPFVQPLPAAGGDADDQAGDQTGAGDTIAYPTLEAAVAAQKTSDQIDEDLRCLAGAIYFESKGEPLAGQLAVAEVILNRADSGRFGKSICSVVKQPGQFSFVRGGQLPSIDPSRPAWRTALAVARVAVADAWDGTAADALYFHARRVSPGWGRVKVAAIGNHVFYR